MDFHPAVMNLLGCGEVFDTNGAGRVSNDDLETWAIRLRSNLALNGLVPAPEEVEHGDRLLHGFTGQLAQLHNAARYIISFCFMRFWRERCR
jgi:hypothetical protein